MIIPNIIKKQLIRFYEFAQPKWETLQIRVKYHFRIMSMAKTIRYIQKTNCSISRFGDGEFDGMFNERDIGFQESSEALQQGLIRAMSNKNPHLLLCLAHSVNSVKGFKPRAKEIWLGWGRNGHQAKVYKLVTELAGREYCFGDALISRPHMDYKSPKNAERIFPMLKELWQDRDLLIVEGTLSRLGVGNDLFANAKSIKRILAPPKNAFDVYDQLLQTVTDQYNGELVLIALGPAASVLASDLADQSIQALDIGHIDVEYEWYLRKATKKSQIEGKFVNEAGDFNREIEECDNVEYKNQIIATIV